MTRKLTALVSCLAVVFVVSAIVSAMSSASMALPTFSGTQETAEGTSARLLIFIQGAQVYVCTAGTYTISGQVNRNLGTIDLDDKSCTQGGEPCNSLGDASGVILITGTWHLVLRTFIIDTHFFLILLNELHIECGKSAIKLILLTGNWQGSIAQKTGSKTAFGVTVRSVGGAGKVQEFSEFENDAGTGVKTAISASEEGSSKAKSAVEESEENVLTFPGETGIEN